MTWKEDEYYRNHGRVEKWTLHVGGLKFTLARQTSKTKTNSWHLEDNHFLWAFIVDATNIITAKAKVEMAIRQKLRTILKEMGE